MKKEIVMLLTTKENRFGFRKIIQLLIILGATVLLISPVSADTGVTIAAQWDGSYYSGEQVIFSGYNYDSDFTYLFIFGQGISTSGGKLSSPQQNVVNGNPDSFDRVKTKTDKSWEYILYTHNLGLFRGNYTIYAVSQPKTKDQLEGSEFNNTVNITIRKSFITAEISPLSIPKGQPFTIAGLAEGNPSFVQIWIIGDNYLFQTTTSVNSDSYYAFKADTKISGNLPKGQCYVIVQHPMQNNRFDITAKENIIINTASNNPKIFNFKSSEKWNASDAKNALIQALNDPDIVLITGETYTILPLVVDDTGISGPPAQRTETTPIQNQIQPSLQPSLIQYAPVGAIVLILGILILGFVMWSRR